MSLSKYSLGRESHTPDYFLNSSALDVGYVDSWEKFLFRIAHAFSIGSMSGLWAGQGSNLIPSPSKYSFTDLARFGLHPSCWNLMLPVPQWYCLANGSKFDFSISMYLCWLKLPPIRINGVRPQIENAVHTYMDRYPDLNVATKLTVVYRSPSFLQTLLHSVVGLRVNVIRNRFFYRNT